MNSEKLKELRIDRGDKRRPAGTLWAIFLVVIAVTLIAIYFARPKPEDNVRRLKGGHPAVVNDVSNSATTLAASKADAQTNAPAKDDVVLTVSGYIINRERIEISPRFLGVVKWIGVKKGDVVTNGEVVVLLDDTEYKARLVQAEGQLANAKAMVAKDELSFQRVHQLAKTDIESKEAEDNARLTLEADRAALAAARGACDVARTYLDWCTIHSPIDGVVLEKLVSPNELVMPQSFGGARGPSTALIAVADPKDLQVEIDVNESDLAKISLNEKCRVSPEAFPEKTYAGHVAEIAPEADRAKGTLQIKVQIHEPDRFLTPELSAKVEFLKAD